MTFPVNSFSRVVIIDYVEVSTASRLLQEWRLRHLTLPTESSKGWRAATGVRIASYNKLSSHQKRYSTRRPSVIMFLEQHKRLKSLFLVSQRSFNSYSCYVAVREMVIIPLKHKYWRCTSLINADQEFIRTHRIRCSSRDSSNEVAVEKSSKIM